MKPIKPLLLATLCIIGLASCCSTEKFEQRLNSYVNRPKIDVLQAFGTPIRSERVGNEELITFLRDRTYFDEGTPASFHSYERKNKDGTKSYDSYMSQGTPAHYVYQTCEFTFRINRGRVVSWSHNGNDCCDE